MSVRCGGEGRKGFTVANPVSPIPNVFAVSRLRFLAVPVCLAGLAGVGALGAAAAGAAPLPPQMHTVAGGGSCSGPVTAGGKCDGVAATSVPILGARSVAAVPGGGFLYIDYGSHLVREVSPGGVVRTVAGTSTTTAFNNMLVPSSTDVDCVPATQSGLDDPVGVAVLPNGGYLITEFAGNRVRMVSPNGIITTIAGTPPTASVLTTQDNPAGSTTLLANTTGFPPTGMIVVASQTLTYTSLTATAFVLSQPTAADIPASSTVELSSAIGCPEYADTTAGTGPTTPLVGPSDAIPTASGGVLIADTYADTIMLLDSWANPGAAIQPIAGGGTCDDATSSCDGLDASQVQLHLPASISELDDNSGGYLVAETGADAVRQISQESPSGVVTTVAGEPGQGGYSGDGGPALSAQLSQPEGVLSLTGGGFLIADTGNNLVREVSPTGIISTVAGVPQQVGYTGDGGAATAAELNGPSQVAVTDRGGILIADDDNGAIREITQPPTSVIELVPGKPNGRHGWYTRPPLIAVAVTILHPTIACVVDPAQAPPVFAAIAPGCEFASGFVRFALNGTHTIYAATENTFGDQQNPVSVTFKLDTKRPKLTCRYEPSFSLDQSKAVVLATLRDTVSGPASKRVMAIASTTRAGRHTVRIRGRNVAGLWGSVVCPYFVRHG